MKAIIKFYLSILLYITSRKSVQKFKRSGKLGYKFQKWSRGQYYKYTEPCVQDIDFKQMTFVAYTPSPEDLKNRKPDHNVNELSCKEVFALCKDMKIAGV